MKARTKAQRLLLEYSDSLGEITKDQVKYAFDKCFTKTGYRTKTKGTGCLECGHVWQLSAEITACKCPNCKAKITIEDTTKKKSDQGKKYFSVLETSGDMQIVRIYELQKWCEVGHKARIHIWEVVQQFFRPGEMMQVVARCRTTSFNIDSFGGQLECRKIHHTYRSDFNKYDIWTDVTYPKIEVLPIYERNGYSPLVEGISHYLTMQAILRDCKAETLLKSNQIGLLACRVGNRSHKVEEYWNSIKICIRNKYNVGDEEVITWLDYLDMIAKDKKDLHSPKWVCPPNLKEIHAKKVAKKQMEAELGHLWYKYCDLVRYFNEPTEPTFKGKLISLKLEVKRLTASKREIERRLTIERKEQAAMKVREVEQQFMDRIASYKDLAFKKGNITIVALRSIDDFFEESQALKHCVFSNEYYAKKDSLILSARIKDERIETIEVSLTDFKVIQSRGKYNSPSAHNSDIVALIKKNLPAIRKVYKESRRVAA
ncbi:PcfJ domain-containing protein [Mucilaginibacter sp. SP1R1]|uniref:PcfJ domain-containing protein n=1 Tax=Mucilaginibacter sp. SP1R1 TaxID=2723091 RepID=UPI0016145698|nr:PcfJ domain-containing protein [Mucilaginibacter sp. SP1R1]MBB6149445.1 putative Zn-ribbon and HTH transcriptional regulator [Mucilaginibacter sp. SP1R1]